MDIWCEMNQQLFNRLLTRCIVFMKDGGTKNSVLAASIYSIFLSAYNASFRRWFAFWQRAFDPYSIYGWLYLMSGPKKRWNRLTINCWLINKYNSPIFAHSHLPHSHAAQLKYEWQKAWKSISSLLFDLCVCECVYCHLLLFHCAAEAPKP